MPNLGGEGFHGPFTFPSFLDGPFSPKTFGLHIEHWALGSFKRCGLKDSMRLKKGGEGGKTIHTSFRHIAAGGSLTMPFQ